MSFFKAILLATMIAACVFSCTPKAFADDDCDFYEDFESGIGDWWIGQRGVGSGNSHYCRGPVRMLQRESVRGDYPQRTLYGTGNTDSHFISPSIRLPEHFRRSRRSGCVFGIGILIQVSDYWSGPSKHVYDEDAKCMGKLGGCRRPTKWLGNSHRMVPEGMLKLPSIRREKSSE